MPDGESIADAEARLGRAVGPVMLKLELQSDLPGGADIEVDAVHATRGAVTLTVRIPGGLVAGDIVPLDWNEHHEYPEGYYTDVTDARQTDGGNLHATIVNDGPAWRSSDGVAIDHQALSLWACDIGWPLTNDQRIDPQGRIWLVYVRRGAVYARNRAHHTLDWSDEFTVVAGAQYHHPSIVPMNDGGVLVSVDDNRRQKTVIFETSNDGGIWSEVA